MNTTTDKKSSMTSISETQEVTMQHDAKDWTQYSQGIAAIMSKRMAELCRWKLYAR